MTRLIISLSLIFILQGCGGGGSDGRTPDSTPGAVPSIDDDIADRGDTDEGDGTADEEEVSEGANTDPNEDAGQGDNAGRNTSEAVVGMSAVYSVLL